MRVAPVPRARRRRTVSGGRGARRRHQPAGDLSPAEAAARAAAPSAGRAGRAGDRRGSLGASDRRHRMVCAWARRRLKRPVNRKRVLRVMREQRLLQRRRRLDRRRRPGFFRVERPDQLWHLDLTSVWLAEHGWSTSWRRSTAALARSWPGIWSVLPRPRVDRARRARRRRSRDRARHAGSAAFEGRSGRTGLLPRISTRQKPSRPSQRALGENPEHSPVSLRSYGSQAVVCALDQTCQRHTTCAPTRLSFDE